MIAKRKSPAKREGRRGQGRPIRVVPLHVPEKIAARAAPSAELTYRGGPLLTAVEVVTVFWGTGWSAAAQQTIAQGVNRFLQDIVASPYMDQLAEYDTPELKIGHGRFAGTANLPAALGASVTDAAIQQMLEAQVAAKAVPAPTPNTLYFVLMPPGVTVAAGSERSCQAFCGYHERSAAGHYYAVVPAPDCAGCLGGLGELDAVTSVCSHELAEAVTDPVPGQGWYDDANGEIGDMCAWDNKKLGSWVVQRLWSNRARACV